MYNNRAHNQTQNTPTHIHTHNGAGHYKEVVSRVGSEQFAEFDHVLIDVNQVGGSCMMCPALGEIDMMCWVDGGGASEHVTIHPNSTPISITHAS